LVFQSMTKNIYCRINKADFISCEEESLRIPRVR
jgi:hypothetical protein